MPFSHGTHVVAKELCEALGLPPENVSRIVLDANCESIVIAYVKLYVTVEQMNKIADTVMLAKVAGDIGPNKVVDELDMLEPRSDALIIAKKDATHA